MPSDESYVLQRVLNASNPVELNSAAVELSRIRDAANRDAALYLQKGEQIYKEYLQNGKMKRCVLIDVSNCCRGRKQMIIR